MKVLKSSYSKESIDGTQAPSRCKQAINADVGPEWTARNGVSGEAYTEDKSENAIPEGDVTSHIILATLEVRQIGTFPS